MNISIISRVNNPKMCKLKYNKRYALYKNDEKRFNYYQNTTLHSDILLALMFTSDGVIIHIRVYFFTLSPLVL